jgi:2-methylisocitrate lyase-like PEP mutase family enzyme
VTDQRRRAEAFRAMHREPPLLVLANAWDVASAAVVASVPGCRAIASSSAASAAVLGYPDGERIPRAEMLDLVGRIVRAVEQPVSADLEAGYGDPAGTARAAWEVGAVGLNLEDGDGDPDEHAARIRAVRAAVPELVVNARVDRFLLGDRDLDETLRRAAAYLEAGADCVFVPGVVDAETIGQLAAGIGGPLNVLAGPGTPPVVELQRLGVARVSVGSGLMRAVSADARRRARAILGEGRFDVLDGAVGFAELGDLLEPGL